MAKISAKDIVILIVLIDIVQTADTNICIFGEDDECFFKCKCQKSPCSVSEPKCESCNNVTGVCTEDEGQTACLEDALLSSVYEKRYWSGSGCQTGNIAYRMDILDENNIITLPEATDGSMYSGTTHYISSEIIFKATMQFTYEHKVEFIDIFEDSFNSFSVLLSISLEKADGTISPCKRSASFDNRLNPSVSSDYKRIHYTCETPSIARTIRMISEGTSFGFIQIQELVIIGYKHADVKDSRCLKTEGEEDLKWCSQCVDSYPPECRQHCPQGVDGANCEGTEQGKSSSASGSSEARTFIIIGVALAVIVITSVVIVTTIVACRKHNNKGTTKSRKDSSALSAAAKDDDTENSELKENVISGVVVTGVVSEKCTSPKPELYRETKNNACHTGPMGVSETSEHNKDTITIALPGNESNISAPSKTTTVATGMDVAVQGNENDVSDEPKLQDTPHKELGENVLAKRIISSSASDKYTPTRQAPVPKRMTQTSDDVKQKDKIIASGSSISHGSSNTQVKQRQNGAEGHSSKPDLRQSPGSDCCENSSVESASSYEHPRREDYTFNENEE